jgi:hypothetical protein
MHINLLFGVALLVFASVALCIILIWIVWREFWTPGLALGGSVDFLTEQSKLRLGEAYLSRELLHPYLGYVLNPAADEPVWKADGLERPPINSFGLIAGRESLDRRMEGKLTVAIFGGSVAMHLAANHKDVLLNALKSATAPRDKEIEVVCYAIPGFKQPQQMASLAYFRSLGVEFDVVINLDGFNEVALHPAENAFKGVCHSFPRSWASRTATRIDPRLVFLFGQLAFIQEQRASLWRFLKRFPFNWIPQIYLPVRMYESRLRSRKARVIKSIRQFRPPVEGNLNSALNASAPMAGQLADLWARSSRLMHDLCKSKGMLYLHFLQPNQYLPESKPLTPEEMATAFDPDHPYRPGVIEGYPLLKAAGQTLHQEGVAFTDLTMLFADCHETVYSDRCCHFNQRGNEIVAAAIAAEVSRAMS